ncbi:MAG: GDSL-like Lipase/Acylhydrolase [Syntrophaceae bacterium PtaB.Bin038]|nr:MAG: GDSL-like Lipase/Acylhydrolase [Syntrophaceae bacterium PtaB.Bin038]
MRRLILAILIGAAGLGAYQVSMLAVRIHRGREIAAASRPFELRNPASTHRILVVGDSTGVGTGAARPEESVAGRIAAEFPCVEVVNLARNGATARDALTQLESVRSAPFRIVLVQVGGNDILGFTDMGELRGTILQVLAKAREKGKAVLFMSTGNVGLAPAFFPPVSWLYTARTRQARAIFMEAAETSGVEYVDLFREKGDDLFLGDPDRYYTPDYLHPGSEGYRVWYEELKKQTRIAEILGKPNGCTVGR